MTVLITGGTGFIGTEVARILLSQGETAPVLFDLHPSTLRLGEIADQVEIRRGDLGVFSHVLRVVEETRPSMIYHLGGMLSVPSEADPAGSLQANVMGTFHVLEAARLFQVPQVIFTSTVASYGYNLPEDTIDDYTLQRPQFIYGATKAFGEYLGLFFKRKYGLDFRSVRFPAVVGPGVKSRGIVQYTSWAIEESAKGQPFTFWVNPETVCSAIYYKDAAGALVRLAAAPLENIKMTNYILGGFKPMTSAGELAEIVREKIPGAQLSFDPDPELQVMLDAQAREIDDSKARSEWGWAPNYDQRQIVDDFLEEMRRHPTRYA